MTGLIGRLCALSVFCGLVMSLMPEGGAKRMAAIGCTAALLLTLSGALQEVKPELFLPELAYYRELEQELTERSGELRDSLNRSVIEREYEAYICDEAARLGIPGLQAKVTARWDMAGYFLPYEVHLTADCGERERRALTDRIEAELGIPKERIIWDDEN